MELKKLQYNILIQWYKVEGPLYSLKRDYFHFNCNDLAFTFPEMFSSSFFCTFQCLLSCWAYILNSCTWYEILLLIVFSGKKPLKSGSVCHEWPSQMLFTWAQVSLPFFWTSCLDLIIWSFDWSNVKYCSFLLLSNRTTCSLCHHKIPKVGEIFSVLPKNYCLWLNRKHWLSIQHALTTISNALKLVITLKCLHGWCYNITIRTPISNSYWFHLSYKEILV